MSDGVLDVFRDIHDNCNEKVNCDGCDFYSNKFGCAFRHIPEAWRMKTIENAVKKSAERLQKDDRRKFAEWLLRKDISCGSTLSVKDLARSYVEDYEKECGYEKLS